MPASVRPRQSLVIRRLSEPNRDSQRLLAHVYDILLAVPTPTIPDAHDPRADAILPDPIPHSEIAQ